MKAHQMVVGGVDGHDAKGRFDVSLGKVTALA